MTLSELQFDATVIIASQRKITLLVEDQSERHWKKPQAEFFKMLDQLLEMRNIWEGIS